MQTIKTLADFESYSARVTSFLWRNKVRPGCYGAVDPEAIPFFSGRSCECCDSPLAGNRETYSFASVNGPFNADICSDCVYFLAYGVLDDETMHNLYNSIS